MKIDKSVYFHSFDAVFQTWICFLNLPWLHFQDRLSRQLSAARVFVGFFFSPFYCVCVELGSFFFNVGMIVLFAYKVLPQDTLLTQVTMCGFFFFCKPITKFCVLIQFTPRNGRCKALRARSLSLLISLSLPVSRLFLTLFKQFNHTPHSFSSSAGKMI